MKLPKSCMELIFTYLKPLNCLKMYDQHEVLNFDLLNFILNFLLNFRIWLSCSRCLEVDQLIFKLQRFSNQIGNQPRLSNIFFLFKYWKISPKERNPILYDIFYCYFISRFWIEEAECGEQLIHSWLDTARMLYNREEVICIICMLFKLLFGSFNCKTTFLACSLISEKRIQKFTQSELLKETDWIFLFDKVVNSTSIDSLAYYFGKPWPGGGFVVRELGVEPLIHPSGADPDIFQKGVEEENFKRKMFFDTRINAYTHKN